MRKGEEERGKEGGEEGRALEANRGALFLNFKQTKASALTVLFVCITIQYLKSNVCVCVREREMEEKDGGREGGREG